MAKLMPGDKVTFLYNHEHYVRKSQRGRVVNRARNSDEFVFMGHVGADGNHRVFALSDEGVTWVRGWHDANSNPDALDALFAAFKLAQVSGWR